MPENYCVIGYPIGHTMSPFIQARLFAVTGRDAVYGVREISPDALPSAMPSLRRLSGFNVTIPHKQRILPFLDALDPVAARYQSVNTVSCENGRLIGHNTDAFGFLRALQTAGIPLAGRVLLCGTGGVARTMAHEVLRAGCDLTLSYRAEDVSQATALCEELAAVYGRAPVLRLTKEVDADFDLLLNATPVGMYPKTDACPVSEAQIARCNAVFDVIYNPQETFLLRTAARLGKRTGGGLPMLVWQAAQAQTYWCGAEFTEAQIAEITAAAAAELSRLFGKRDNLILCGFMGSGKTTVGRLLAERTGRRFVDTDAAVEAKAGMSVSDYFAAYSEEAFRALETETLADLCKADGQVIALGGGIPVRPENRALLQTGGTVVWLDVTAETVLRRLADDDTRPLLRGRDRAARVNSLLNERRACYAEAADLTVDANGSAEEAVAEICRALA